MTYEDSSSTVNELVLFQISSWIKMEGDFE